MLLKDLKIEFENFTIRMEAEVIIKRDGKPMLFQLLCIIHIQGKKLPTMDLSKKI